MTTHRPRAALLGAAASVVLTLAACSVQGDDLGAGKSSAAAKPAAAKPSAAAPAAATPRPAPPNPTPPPALAPTGPNVLVNPGFEAGAAGWTRMPGANWGDFDITTFPVRTGLKSGHVRVEADAASTQAARVYGLVQGVAPKEFPEVLSGWYRVQGWDKSAADTDLYAQVVVIVWGDPRTPTIVNPQKPPEGLNNYQIRYYLAGLTEPAFLLSNARVKFLAKGPPVTGEWLRFEIPIRRDFLDNWGVVPEGYQFIRVLFEARYDNRVAGSTVRADVYYDDLYMGPAPAPR